jgi:RND family efflux transporter MFP subunit
MKKKTIVVSVVAAAAIGAMAWTLTENKKEIDLRKEVKVSDGKIAVSVAAAQMREMSSSLELVGVAEPDRKVVVASESAGKLVQINFGLGDFVEKGAVLAKVDDTYKRLALENALLTYDKYREDYERYQKLREGDAVSESQLRDVKVAFESSALQLENAQRLLEDTKIVAPFSGVITAKSTELGAYLNAGTPVAAMADVAQLKVLLAVSEANVYRLRKGQEVVVSANVYPDVAYRGKIASISPQGSSTHTFPVEIAVANSSRKPLMAGTYVNVRVDMGAGVRALMVPREAIVSSVKDPSVYVVRGETVALVKITTGQDYGTHLEVSSGIAEGEQVVTNGQINLMNGAAVSIIQ